VYGESVKGPRKGRYRIQSVAEMTGVPASTLRAWEQRYGFPAPERTASSYRLYSPEEVDRIHRVRALCDRGMAPAEAVAEVLEGSSAPAAPTVVFSGPAPGGPLVEQIVEAAAAVDPRALDARVRSALLVGSRETALVEALEPAWATIRQRWLEGTLGHAAERIAAEIFAAAAFDLVRLGQPAAAIGHAVIAGFGEDEDPVAGCSVALAAQARGLWVVPLGPRTTMVALADAVSALDAALLALTVTEPPPVGRVRAWIDEYARIAQGRSWVVCGPAAASVEPAVRAAGGAVMHGRALPPA
jgi:MerR family transcriptional regulator, light-induced transcriptional regulator